MSLAVTPAFKFVYDTLRGDAQLGALGIHAGRGPRGTPTPFITVEPGPSTTTLVLGGRKLWNTVLVQVEAWTDGTDVGPIEGIANRIDDVLHMAAGATVGGTVIQCVNESEVMVIEPPAAGEDGWAHLGAVYRIKAQTT